MRQLLLYGMLFSVLGFQPLWANHPTSARNGSASNYQTTVVVCPSCHFQNPYGSTYCSHCGGVIVVQQVGGVTCSYCSFVNQQGAGFCGGCGRSLETSQVVYVVCPHCHKKYVASESGCPYCSEDEDHHQSTTTYTTTTNTGPIITYPVVTTPNIYNPGRSRVYTPNSSPNISSGGVLLDTFHKDNFDKLRKEYDISGRTNGCSFSKLIVDVKVNEKFAVILNTVHVRINGQWKETTLGKRLNDGRNEFSVNFPEGSTGVTCSFTHGRGSDVTVSLGN